MPSALGQQVAAVQCHAPHGEHPQAGCALESSHDVHPAPSRRPALPDTTDGEVGSERLVGPSQSMPVERHFEAIRNLPEPTAILEPQPQDTRTGRIRESATSTDLHVERRFSEAGFGQGRLHGGHPRGIGVAKEAEGHVQRRPPDPGDGTPTLSLPKGIQVPQGNIGHVVRQGDGDEQPEGRGQRPAPVRRSAGPWPTRPSAPQSPTPPCHRRAG